MRLAYSMASPITAVQRMFVATFIVAAATWYTQDNYTEGALVLIALSALIGIAWGLSEREMTFETSRSKSGRSAYHACVYRLNRLVCRSRCPNLGLSNHRVVCPLGVFHRLFLVDRCFNPAKEQLKRPSKTPSPLA